MLNTAHTLPTFAEAPDPALLQLAQVIADKLQFDPDIIDALGVAELEALTVDEANTGALAAVLAIMLSDSPAQIAYFVPESVTTH